MDLNETLKDLGKDYFIQGNLDPSLLHLPKEILLKKWDTLWDSVRENPHLEKWICALGHGVLPSTPQENVRLSVEYIHRNFIY
jgi:uroporphyrinogen decarboxylase